MKLKQVIKYIDFNLEFEIHGWYDRFGVFSSDDKGLEPYLDKSVEKIDIIDGRLCNYIDKE